MDCRSLVSRWSAGLARAFRGIAFVGVSIVGIGVPVPIAFAQSAPLSTQPPLANAARGAAPRDRRRDRQGALRRYLGFARAADGARLVSRCQVWDLHPLGVYSVPAFGNEWYPRNMYLAGTPEFAHHVKTFGAQSKFGYKDFIPQFKAERFDPAAWADLFSKAGARFVVPVAEHHDGFAMYDSAWSDWTAAKMGPKRDCIGLLAGAVRAKGMTLGVSSHRAEHWWYFEGGRRFDSDVKDPNNAGLYAPAEPESAPPRRPSARIGCFARASSSTSIRRSSSGSIGGSSSRRWRPTAGSSRPTITTAPDRWGWASPSITRMLRFRAGRGPRPRAGAARSDPRGLLADRHVDLEELLGARRTPRLQDGALDRWGSGRHREQERSAPPQHRPEGRRHDPRGGAGDPPRDRRLAPRERRCHLCHAPFSRLRRGADERPRGVVHRHGAPAVHRGGHPLHHEKRSVVCDRDGVAHVGAGDASRARLRFPTLRRHGERGPDARPRGSAALRARPRGLLVELPR